MGKTLENIVRRARRLVIPVTITALLATSPVAYYGAKQKNSEYRTLHTIEKILRERGNDTNANIAIVMSMVKKESSFYEGASGRDGEAGLLQLKQDVAEQEGLKTSKGPSKKSDRMHKLFYINPDSKDDERLNAEKNLRAGIRYYFSLVNMYERKYGMDKPQAIQFGLIAYNLGPNNVGLLLRKGFGKDPKRFIDRLARVRLTKYGITDKKRATTVDYLVRTNRFRGQYEVQVSSMREIGSPTFGEYLSSYLNSFREIYERLRN